MKMALVVLPGHHLHGGVFTMQMGASLVYVAPTLPSAWDDTSDLAQSTTPFTPETLAVREVKVGHRRFLVAAQAGAAPETAILALIDATPQTIREVEVTA